MERYNLKQQLFFSFLFVIVILSLTAWLASLVIPDWEFFILFPFWHSMLAWVIFGVVAFLMILILYTIVDLAIDKQVLERKTVDLGKENKELHDKIVALEKEYWEIKKRKD